MKVLAFSLSLRQGSLNKKLLALALQSLPSTATSEVIDLKAYELPSYDGDIETSEGVPKNGLSLAEKIKASDAIIIASPEYNYSYPGHFKNTFDWLSRIKRMPWVKKPVLLLSASLSLVGGNRGLWHLRVPFEATSAFVFPDMFSLAAADKAFDANGNLQDAGLNDRLKNMVSSFIRFSQNLQL